MNFLEKIKQINETNNIPKVAKELSTIENLFDKTKDNTKFFNAVVNDKKALKTIEEFRKLLEKYS